jgi:hypothetical protein
MCEVLGNVRLRLVEFSSGVTIRLAKSGSLR